MKKGFTLIELLVVVLIIGILASVALPQYEKAVVKARFSEAFINLNAMANALQLCELANGKQPSVCSTVDELDIEWPDQGYSGAFTKNFRYFIDRGGLNDNDVMAVAGYNQAEVCVCRWRDGHFSVGQNDVDCVNGKHLNFDISKVLKIEDDGCSCC